MSKIIIAVTTLVIGALGAIGTTATASIDKLETPVDTDTAIVEMTTAPEWTGDYRTPVTEMPLVIDTIDIESEYNNTSAEMLCVVTPVGDEYSGVPTVDARGDKTMETTNARVIVNDTNIVVYGYDGSIAVFETTECTVTC